MPQPSQTTKTKSRAKSAAKRRKGNGGAKTNGSRANAKAHANGNGRPKATANGNGRPKAHKIGNGNGNGAAGIEDARRLATEIGNAMLVATSVETARHSDDVELISDALCENFEITGHDRDDILAAARLHDIGKTSVPKDILEKPGPLDGSEWDLMREHTVIGEQILASVVELDGIASLVRHSHERWDGDGYPDGLVGDDIPLGSRIIFCADAFHAVRSDRPYRRGISAPEALKEISRCAGTQFDPRVVAALEEVVRELKIVGPVRRTRRSSRLTALLLVLAIGGGGSAIARTDLLGEPGAGSSAPAGEIANPFDCQSLHCSSLFGSSLLDQLKALKLSGAAHPIESFGPIGRSPGSTSQSGALVNQERGESTDGGGQIVTDPDGGSGGGGTTDPGGGAGGGQGGGTQGGGQGNANGGGGGNGNANGQSNGNGNGNGGSAGQSGNAPGHGGSCPGNSCNAPGHQPGGPGNSGNAPGQQPGGPGNSGGNGNGNGNGNGGGNGNGHN